MAWDRVAPDTEPKLTKLSMFRYAYLLLMLHRRTTIAKDCPIDSSVFHSIGNTALVFLPPHSYASDWSVIASASAPAINIVLVGSCVVAVIISLIALFVYLLPLLLRLLFLSTRILNPTKAVLCLVVALHIYYVSSVESFLFLLVVYILSKSKSPFCAITKQLPNCTYFFCLNKSNQSNWYSHQNIHLIYNLFMFCFLVNLWPVLVLDFVYCQTVAIIAIVIYWLAAACLLLCPWT